MHRTVSTDNPALFPLENPNPVFRAAADGTVLFGNRASDELLASWGTSEGYPLPPEWRELIAGALASGGNSRLPVTCADRQFELDVVPIVGRGYVNVYGRDVTDQETARREREALLAELRRERDLQQTLMDHSRASLVYLDRDFNILRCNAAYEAACQRPASELLGRNHFALFPNAENEAIFRQARDTGREVEFRAKPFEFADQPWRGVTYWDWTLTPVKSAAGEVEGLVYSLVDVTEMVSLTLDNARVLALESEQRQAAEARSAELETILESITDGVVIYDAEGKFVRQNTAALNMLGYGPENGQLPVEERRQRLQAVLVDEPDAGPERLPLMRALRGEHVRGALVAMRLTDDPEGAPRFMRVSSEPIHWPGAERPGVVTTFSDVTELREARDELARRVEDLQALTGEVQALNASLEQRVQERTAELEAIFAAVPDGLFVATQGGIVRANQAALKDLGADSVEELQDDLANLAERLQSRFVDTGRRIAPHELGVARALRGESSVADVITCHPRSKQEQIHRTAAAPIAVNGKVVAAVVLAANITDQKRTQLALARSARQLEILHDIDHAVLAAESVDITAEKAIRRLKGALPFDRAVITLIDFEAARVRYLVAEGPGPEGHETGQSQPIDMPPHILEALAKGETYHIPDMAAQAGQPSSQQKAVSLGMRSWLAVPLQVEGRTVGALNLAANVPGAFSAEDIELAQQIADSLAVALQNAHLLDELNTRREQLKHLSHRLVERQETERGYVANELYNDEGQRLAALLLELGMLEAAAQADRALADRLARAKELGAGVLEDMHNLAVTLRPASLDRVGLMAALRAHAEELARHHALTIQVELSGLKKVSLPPDVETTLYRMAQEAVSNAILHAQAGQIGIVATQHGDRLILMIEDDGAGFDVEEATRCGGLGIVGMRERAEMLGGKLTIESSPGRGTTVYIEAPVREREGVSSPRLG